MSEVGIMHKILLQPLHRIELIFFFILHWIQCTLFKSTMKVFFVLFCCKIEDKIYVQAQVQYFFSIYYFKGGIFLLFVLGIFYLFMQFKIISSGSVCYCQISRNFFKLKLFKKNVESCLLIEFKMKNKKDYKQLMLLNL